MKNEQGAYGVITPFIYKRADATLKEVEMIDAALRAAARYAAFSRRSIRRYICLMILRHYAGGCYTGLKDSGTIAFGIEIRPPLVASHDICAVSIISAPADAIIDMIGCFIAR